MNQLLLSAAGIVVFKVLLGMAAGGGPASRARWNHLRKLSSLPLSSQKSPERIGGTPYVLSKVEIPSSSHGAAQSPSRIICSSVDRVVVVHFTLRAVLMSRWRHSSISLSGLTLLCCKAERMSSLRWSDISSLMVEESQNPQGHACWILGDNLVEGEVASHCVEGAWEEKVEVLVFSATSNS